MLKNEVHAQVFVTVGSAAKKAYLLERFPLLDKEDIGNSRSASFERMIMERTSGKGVDFVLNSLDKEKLQVRVSVFKRGCHPLFLFLSPPGVRLRLRVCRGGSLSVSLCVAVSLDMGKVKV